MKIPERPHKRLNVWKRAMELVAQVYSLALSFPRGEEFGLTAQLRRSAVSIPSNIAEGLARNSANDKRRFLYIAQGSLSELDTQVEIAGMVGYIGADKKTDLLLRIHDVQMLLTGLIRSIKQA